VGAEEPDENPELEAAEERIFLFRDECGGDIRLLDEELGNGNVMPVFIGALKVGKAWEWEYAGVDDDEAAGRGANFSIGTVGWGAVFAIDLIISTDKGLEGACKVSAAKPWCNLKTRKIGQYQSRNEKQKNAEILKNVSLENRHQNV
jgi:hypothetical protein